MDGAPPPDFGSGAPGADGLSADALRAQWVERDAAVVWHGFTQMAAYPDNSPVLVERAEGREVIDVAGRRYLDAISSLWVTTLGHRVPELDAALRDQLDKVAHTTLLGNGNRVVVELAEALAAVVPVDAPHFLFASDGAAAVEQAAKIALQYRVNQGDAARSRFLALGSAYHGDTVGSLSLGDGGFGADLLDPLAEELTAVVLEPLVQGASGILIADPTDVGAFGRAARERGVLVVADEVATGFGRTGRLFASEGCDLRPDILCLGKGITGGYLPMSATVAGGHVYDTFLGEDLGPRTLYHGHSYGGNALAAAVARAHLRVIERDDVLANVRARGAQFEELLAPLARHAAVGA